MNWWDRLVGKEQYPKSLKERLAELENTIDEVDRRQKRLDVQFQTLSGRYYRRFGTGEEKAATSLPEFRDRKERLRYMAERAGLMKGRSSTTQLDTED